MEQAIYRPGEKMINVEVVDVFCGVGGLSHGLRSAGANIVAGFDLDEGCRFPFETNNDAVFHQVDAAKLRPCEVSELYAKDAIKVLAGCAPCQPFSKYKARYGHDPQWNLVNDFGKLASESNVDVVTMENVPQLLKYKQGAVVRNLVRMLECAGFKVWFNVEKATDYGVPQLRERFVLIGSRLGEIIYPSRDEGQVRTVRDAIEYLPEIKAGDCYAEDPLHCSSQLSELNLKRIRASKPGGTWEDWPADLVAACHRKQEGRGYKSVYGRMQWDAPAPTLTTQCYGFGNGRFGHPEQDRAISLREAAILQSFPANYNFGIGSSRPQLKTVGKWIGNAVPVGLAHGIGAGILEALNG